MKDKQGKGLLYTIIHLGYAGQSLDAEIERIKFDDIVQPIIYAISFISSCNYSMGKLHNQILLLNLFILALAQ